VVTAAIGFVRRCEFARNEFFDRFVGVSFDSRESGYSGRRQSAERSGTDTAADDGVHTSHHKPETYGFMSAAFGFGDVAVDDSVVFDRVDLKFCCFAEMLEDVVVFKWYGYCGVHDAFPVG
jgi:hypothetical protein